MSKDVKESVVPTKEEDFARRCENANNEIKPILENYKLGLNARFEYHTDGIKPKVVYLDLKEEVKE